MTANDVEVKPRKAMNPDRLRKLIDSPSIANASRDTPMAIVKQQTQVTSWNGEQCDIRAFGKLAPSAQIVLTKDLRACTIGDGKPVPLVSSGLQMTDIVDRLTVPLMTTKESFASAPEVEYRVIPWSVMLDEGIMTPQQRRERLHFETDHYHANRAIRRANQNDRRLHQIIKERHWTSDVIGTQCYSAGPTRVRGEAYKPDMLSHNATGTCGREYQSKNCNANPRLQHHGRLFNNETPPDRNQHRAQNLRNESTAGRSYDIVNGGRVEFFPSTIPEKQHRWQSHPSITLHPYTR
ncbi:hypothetical protein PHMEG_00085 [Phytophthora megakarya]|uniref:Uncharacterized protein n=1 Tax=Phytophthora megakarya TaxID=4795 RepID=A0A225X4I9_9STRA|nr:hypothetical protein PHMEG_00085 [Phytophthora megakarya]